jgi:hypothetical protein
MIREIVALTIEAVRAGIKVFRERKPKPTPADAERQEQKALDDVRRIEQAYQAEKLRIESEQARRQAAAGDTGDRDGNPPRGD